jgi:hypothetical protein
MLVGLQSSNDVALQSAIATFLGKWLITSTATVAPIADSKPRSKNAFTQILTTPKI